MLPVCSGQPTAAQPRSPQEASGQGSGPSPASAAQQGPAVFSVTLSSDLAVGQSVNQTLLRDGPCCD